MTNTCVTQPHPLGRAKLLLALLAASAMLTTGAQALVPTPALAVMDDGGEPCDPNSSADCEPDKGAGSGTDSGPGTVTAGTYRRPGDGLPSEPIHTEGTAPKQSTVPRSSEVGGRRGPGRDDGRSARAPRPRGALTRGRNGSLPSPQECNKLQKGQVVTPFDQQLSRYSDLIAALEQRAQDTFVRQEALEKERSTLEEVLPSDNPAVVSLTDAIGSVEVERFTLRSWANEQMEQQARVKHKRDAQLDHLRSLCGMYRDLPDDQ